MGKWKLPKLMEYALMGNHSSDQKLTDHFVTFIKSEYADHIRQAADELGLKIYIGRRTQPGGYVEVRSQESSSLSEFWHRFAELRDAD